MPGLEQQRARFAADRILRDRFEGAKSMSDGAGDVRLGEYRSVVLGAEAYLRQCGLLQLSSFWLGKRASERAVLEDVLKWLCLSPITAGICKANNDVDEISAAAEPRVMLSLLQRSSQELAILESEARAIIAWLKRLADAKCQQIKAATSVADEQD